MSMPDSAAPTMVGSAAEISRASADPAGAAAIPLSRIRTGANPRRYFDRQKHDELVASLRLRGMLQPLLVRPAADADDTYIIVAGERRFRAAQEVFDADAVVPALVRTMSDQEALEAAIDENDIRDDASETEQADAAVRVLAACNGERAEAARRLGWSPAKLDRRLALANLSEAVKHALDERRIKVGHAELLAVVPGDKQDKALDTILTAGLDVSKTRELLMRVTQSLAHAVFDKSECTTCPFNSGAQRALFETHVDDGHCTNPGCYQLKSEAPIAGAAVKAGALPGAAPTDAEEAAGPQPTAAAGSMPAAAPEPTPAAAGPAPAKAAPVTTATIVGRVAGLRETALRDALLNLVTRNPAMGAEFEAALRDVWQVDEAFLKRLSKDELKFVAKECGLVAHMGAKAFAKLLEGKPAAIVAGMLNAPGFSWAGRLPSAMTLSGEYGPPAAPAAQA